MFGMRERLKLARAARVPFAKIFVALRLRQNLREELRLRAKNFGFQSGFFASFLDGGKIDVRGQILFAGIRQNIVGCAMAKISAQRAVGARSDFAALPA